jgi:hypothetical protein
MGEVRLNGGKSGQMAFQTKAGLQIQAIGWLRKGRGSLSGGMAVRFPYILEVIWEMSDYIMQATSGCVIRAA